MKRSKGLGRNLSTRYQLVSDHALESAGFLLGGVDSRLCVESSSTLRFMPTSLDGDGDPDLTYSSGSVLIPRGGDLIDNTRAALPDLERGYLHAYRNEARRGRGHLDCAAHIGSHHSCLCISVLLPHYYCLSRVLRLSYKILEVYNVLPRICLQNGQRQTDFVKDAIKIP